MRLGPYDPFLWAFYHLRGSCRLKLKQFEQAVADYNLAIQFQGHQFYPHLFLASALGSLGQREKAQEAYHRAYQLRPELRGVKVRDLLPHTNLEYFEDGLRKAGLPTQ